MLQFWGSVLQLTPHAHSWLPDGVFHTGEDKRLRFHRLSPASDEELEDLGAGHGQVVAASAAAMVPGFGSVSSSPGSPLLRSGAQLSEISLTPGVASTGPPHELAPNVGVDG